MTYKITRKTCPICSIDLEKNNLSLEKHLQKHIDDSYKREQLAFKETQEARGVYKKLFKKEPKW